MEVGNFSPEISVFRVVGFGILNDILKVPVILGAASSLRELKVS